MKQESKISILESRNSELLFYIVIWGIVFAIPWLVAFVNGYSSGGEYDFSWVKGYSIQAVAFLALFLVHNFLLAPLLFKQKKALYIVSTCLLLVIFGAWVFIGDSHRRNGRIGAPPELRMMDEGPSFSVPRDSTFEMDVPPPPGMRGPRPGRGPDEMFPLSPKGRPMTFEIIQLLMAVLLMMANIGVKFYFQGMANERRMEELEKENLSQQLDYLRHQISPHFFMNTLNNIHALVDIDPELAKSTILELSRLLRYLLYEGSRPSVSLDKEVEFMQKYINLMRLRYDSKVSIECEFPGDTSGVEVPTLLFINFLENAFKHGVSYENDSFIRARLTLSDGKVVFTCENSLFKKSSPEGEKGGMGTENVHRRLDLLYPGNYTLVEERREGSYNVLLVIHALIPEK